MTAREKEVENVGKSVAVRSALLSSFIAQQSKLIIGFVSTVVIARLLTPAELGVFAVASAAVMLAIEIRSFGISQYIVREPQLNESKLRSALGVMMVVSWSLALILIVASPAIANFYGQPALIELFRMLSITFVLAPFATVPFSIMQRDMRFDLVLRIRIASALARLLGSVGFVLLGWSYYGLAAAVVLGAIVELSMIQLYSKSRAPLRPSLAEWRSVIGFGAPTGAAGLLRQFTAATPDLVLGRSLTMADVGLFSRGLGLVMFLQGIVTAAVAPVVLPHLSRAIRNGRSLGKEYLRCIVLHGALAVPAFAVAGVLSAPLISLFFGPQWSAAVPVAAIVSLWAAIRTVHGFLPKALMVSGEVRTLLGIEATVFIVRLMLVSGAAAHGLETVAWAFVVSGLLELALGTTVARYRLGLGWELQLRAFLPITIMAIMCALVAAQLLIVIVKQTDSAFLQVAGAGLGAVLFWLVALCAVRHPLWYELEGLFRKGLKFHSDRDKSPKQTNQIGK